MGTTMERRRAMVASALLTCLIVAGCGQSTRISLLPEGARFIDAVGPGGELGDIEPAADVSPLAFSGQVDDLNTSIVNAPVPVPSQVQRELNDLKTCLVEGWPSPLRTPELIVSSHPAPGGEAIPGRVTLYLGLLTRDGANAAEVAFVLAHELSHIMLGHYDRVQFLDGQKRASEGFAAAGLLASVVLETQVVNSGGNVTFVTDDSAVAAKAALVVAGLAASQIVFDGVVESSWSREQELEADVLAIDLLISGGIPRFAAPNALLALENFNLSQATRLELFEEIAERRMEEAVATGDVGVMVNTTVNVFTEAAARGVADIYSFVDKPIYSASARMDAIRTYDESTYSGVDTRDLVVGATCDIGGLGRALESRRLAATAESIAAAQQVAQKLAEGKLAEARQLARQGMRGDVRNHPVTRVAAYQVAVEENDRARAIEHLLAVRRDTDTPISVFTFLAADLIAADRLSEAQSVIADGERHFPPDPFYPLRLQLAYARADEDAVDRWRTACRGSDQRAVRRACRGIENNTARTGGSSGQPTGVFDGMLRSLEELVPATGS